MEEHRLYPQRDNTHEKMIRKQAGYSIVELIITMAIFVVTIVAASNIFVSLLSQFKQQSKIAETQIGGLVGMDLFRRDLEQAGFGLPWVISTDVIYNEGSSATTGTIPAPNLYNDATTDPPRPFVSDDNVAGLGGSDYLVIKATSVSEDAAAMKWTHLVGTAGGGCDVKIWGSADEDLVDGDYVISVIPTRGGTNQRILVNNGANFSATFNQSTFPAVYAPSTFNDTFLVYGVNTGTALRMPFNRADYYIDGNATLPPRCAAGTGILVKTVISHTNGNRGAELPIMDCVADMQVVFSLDRNGDGTITYAGALTDTSGTDLTARQIREQVKEVRVYVLAHEGQKDITYTYPNTTLVIPATPDPASGAGRTFNFATSGITDWQHYRWKIYRLAVQPNNLGTL